MLGVLSERGVGNGVEPVRDCQVSWKKEVLGGVGTRVHPAVRELNNKR